MGNKAYVIPSLLFAGAGIGVFSVVISHLIVGNTTILGTMATAVMMVLISIFFAILNRT